MKQISTRLCQNILGPIADETMEIPDSVFRSSVAKQEQTNPDDAYYNLIKDTFNILCAQEIKISNTNQDSSSTSNAMQAQILEAKSKVCEEIYKKYFELISKHVKSYLGQAKDDNTGKISQKNGTDFNNDLTPEAKQAKEKQGDITNVSIKYLQGNENCDNPDNYIIKIEREGENGTEVLYQKVADKYKAKPEEGSTYNAGSIKVYRDGKTGIWKIGRTYTNKEGIVSKVKFMYIDPNGAVQNADDYNTANDIKRPQK